MAILDAGATAQLKQYLELLKLPIELAVSLDDSENSAKTRALVEEVSALSGLISVVEEPHQYVPSFAIRRVDSDVSVRFAGVPLGHEFSSLVLALLQVGGHPPKLDDATVAAIRALKGGEFVTYMSLSCQNCPTVVQALNTMSVLNPKIRHIAVEGGMFQEEVAAKNILAVPAVFKDGELFEQGRMDVEDFLAKLDADSAARAAAALSEKDPFDVLVLGGGPAGAAAAVYTARKALRTGLVAQRFGGQVLDTMAIENFISVPYTEGPRLGAALHEHVRAYDLDVTTGVQASALRTGADGLLEVDFAEGGQLKARSVVLATGARYRTLGVPGEDTYRNKGVTFCPHCDGPLFKGKRVAVIGGGNSGIEAAIDLAGVVSHVTVIEFMDDLKADAVLVSKLHSLPNVEVFTGTRVVEVLGDGSQVTGLQVEERASGEQRRIDLAGVFVQIGLLPNTEWLEGAVERNQVGEIVIDAKGATSLPGVFAAGDCTNVPYKQIVISLGAGATAALSAFDYLIRTPQPTEEGA
ncbi:MAG: alkyl hydroperoxide reductase subunit F [Buchananella hordeovulneris]|nr:alkyl hydroperoxide reductase subunit F [Buchananella hordeovulneris]